MEGYHLSTVHPTTLGNSTPTQLCQKLPGGEYYTAYRAHYPKNAADRKDAHPDIDDTQRRCSTLFSLFPGLVASQSPDLLVWFALAPVSCDQVCVRWGIGSIANKPDQAEVDAAIEKWTNINNEDRLKLEVVHRGLRSRRAAPGPLAPENFEGTIADFNRYLRGRLNI